VNFELTSQGAPRLTENDVEAQVKTFLEFRGWKVIRLHSGLIPLPYERDGKKALIRIGEQGMPDWLAVHPRMHERGKPACIWMELKRPGAKPSRTTMVKSRSGRYRKRKGQIEYLCELDVQGFPCGWFDSLDGFRQFYAKRFE
jgi:hypothetical protein